MLRCWSDGSSPTATPGPTLSSPSYETRNSIASAPGSSTPHLNHSQRRFGNKAARRLRPTSQRARPCRIIEPLSNHQRVFKVRSGL
jgi:hypothetical protein